DGVLVIDGLLLLLDVELRSLCLRLCLLALYCTRRQKIAQLRQVRVLRDIVLGFWRVRVECRCAVECAHVSPFLSRQQLPSIAAINCLSNSRLHAALFLGVRDALKDASRLAALSRFAFVSRGL